MASNQEILARMRKSFVCPSAFGHSLDSLKQRKMSAIIKGKEYAAESGVLKSYIIYDERPDASHHRDKRDLVRDFKAGTLVKSVSLICKVIAKEFVLSRQPVVCYSYVDFVNFAKYQSEVELGSGYIIIPGIYEECLDRPKAERVEAEKLILSHLWRGGGLVLGDAGATECGKLSTEIIDALHRFEFIEVE